MGERIKVTGNKPLSTKENSASNKQKTGFRSQSSHVDQILFLQRTIGNQAVQRLIKSGALQDKLRIGQPGDVYEQEADRVADAVMRMPEPGMQRQVEPEEEEEDMLQAKPLAEEITPLVQRQVEPEEEEEEELQRQPIEEEEKELQRQPLEKEEEEELQKQPIEEKEEELQRQPIEEEEELQAKAESGHIYDVNPHLESQIQSLKGGGRSLSANEGSFFEPRFGRDFSQVRVHTDTRAVEAARAVNARAFTVGQDVVFGGGEYKPGTVHGKRLLAHELTHVLQQSGNHPKDHRKNPLGHYWQTETTTNVIQRRPLDENESIIVNSVISSFNIFEIELHAALEVDRLSMPLINRVAIQIHQIADSLPTADADSMAVAPLIRLYDRYLSLLRGSLQWDVISESADPHHIEVREVLFSEFIRNLDDARDATEHPPIFGLREFVDQVSSGRYPSTLRTPGQVVGLEESYARPTELYMSAFGARPALATYILSGMYAASEDFVFDTPAEIAEDVVGRMEFLDEFMDDVNDIDTEPMVDLSRADLIGYAVYEIMPFEASEFIESEYNRAPGDEDWGPLLEAISRRIVKARSRWTQVAPDLRRLYVMELLVNRYSFPVVGAAAIVGNLWSESQVLPNPDVRALRRPNPPRGAAGLVQWTPPGGRQAGLFQHEFHGRQLGAAILLDMDAQVDYMVNELRTITIYRQRVYAQVMGATSEGQLNAATDRVTRYYEAPGPMGQPQESEEHQATLRARRAHAEIALQEYRAANP